jgi:copper(I)-binding protein
MHKKSLALIALLAGLGATSVYAAGLEVSNAWVRGTVAGQKATGAFMDLKSAEGAALVGAASNVGMTQVHEMTMDGGVMKMREMKKLDLPAGQTVSLKPGGYHVMLMDLKKPLTKGEIIPITLKVQGKDGKTTEVQVKAEVRDLTAMQMEHKH